jgi:transcriptional regulator with XRE-family HTH domain
MAKRRGTPHDQGARGPQLLRHGRAATSFDAQPARWNEPDLAARHRAELKAFLRARRNALTPEDAGVPRGKRRLTPGLRREEVAALAGVGVTWYTWLEQGRDINVSTDTLDRVSRALRLSASDQIYLFTLAGVPPPRLLRHPEVKNLSALQQVLDGFTAGPAVMFDPTFEVLAYNALWDLIYTLDAHKGPFARNHVYRLFADPARRRLYVEYDLVARNMVGLLRAHYAEHLGDHRFEELVEALQDVSTEFARLWEQRRTQPLDAFILRLGHDTLGQLTFEVSRFRVEGSAGALVFLGTPADRETAEVLADARRKVRGAS